MSNTVHIALSQKLKRCSNRHCPSHQQISSNPTITRYNEFKHVLQCNVCTESWIVCLHCHRRFVRAKFMTAEQHFKNVHNISDSHYSTCVPSTSNDSNNSHDYQELQFNTNDDFENLQTISENNQLSEITTYPPNVPQRQFNSTSSAFFKTFVNDKKKAVDALVGKAFLQNDTISTLPTPNETLFHLHTTQFIKKLPQSMHHDFISILNYASHCSNSLVTRIPTNTQDMNRFYVNGKHSIYNQLPIPTPKTLDNHAYVSLESILDHFLAFGFEPDIFQTNDNEIITNNIVTCAESKKIYEDAVQTLPSHINPMILYLTIWSDDFEANSLRKNKHSTWIKTVSICPPINQSTSQQFTYLIAIGHKGSNHDSINEQINKEIIKLSKVNYKYYGKLNKNIPIVVRVLAISADRPERSTLNHMLGHAGTNTRRWRYSAYVNQQTLPSCDRCLTTRIKDIRMNPCKVCFNVTYVLEWPIYSSDV